MKKNKIKYIFSEDVDAQIFEIQKSQIKQIIFEDGSKISIISNPYEVSNEMVLPEHSHAIKMELLAPLLNHFTFIYEINLKKGINLEIKGGLIATNTNVNLKHAEGYFIKGGLKFVKLTTSYLNGIKYVQPLEGTYLKPEIIFDQYVQDDEGNEINYTSYAINLLFGKQKCWNNKWLLDFFVGIGGAVQNTSGESDLTYNFSHIYFGKKLPLILTGGFNMGVAF
jgi:hypothetical protein